MGIIDLGEYSDVEFFTQPVDYDCCLDVYAKVLVDKGKDAWGSIHLVRINKPDADKFIAALKEGING